MSTINERKPESIGCLHNMTAIVTGASKGLGKAFALALAEAGANLSLTCRHVKDLDGTASIAREFGVDVHTFQSDITHENEVQSFIKSTIKHFNKIDICVNNAAAGRINKPPQETSIEDWNTVIDTNVTGMFLLAREVGKHMIARKQGKIINMSSISGSIVNKYFHGGSYDVSKAAVTHLTKALAAEWAPYNITVNAIAPGYYETEPNLEFFDERPDIRSKVLDMIPLNRFGNVQELSKLLVFLCTDATNYMTGSVIKIDGGYTIW